MAALGVDVAINADPESGPRRRNYKATGTLTFYRGSLVCATTAAGTVTNANANADIGLGVCDGLPFKGGRAAVAGDLVSVYVSGSFWFACANFADASLYLGFSPTAASDNPADMVVATTAGTPGMIGLLEVVDATGVSGWLNLNIKANVLNTA